MDFISLAESAGLPEMAAVKAYRLIGGGYYIRLHYAKPPIMSILQGWPRVYRAVHPDSHYVEDAVELMITMDLITIYGTSAVLLGEPIPFSRIEEETANLMRSLGLRSRQVKVPSLPTALIEDLVSKRRRESTLSINSLLRSLALQSKTFQKAKMEHLWLKAVKEEDILRALNSARFLEEFLNEVRVKLAFFIRSRDNALDRKILSEGIEGALSWVREDSPNSLSVATKELDELLEKD
ncbi:hypothetical protein HS1genome_0743 [Sulfodiicoccus acidiphilus]|uniref:Uncharacterized protein n=1 Tax=Sulfodiicoccus acidiphilus TaxID=1670455 RepID=A0A348B2F2_9CREN|nr:hypothetical protein [Sulfodiicoccus acidiphilus]BBD72354.1 hypothetical protein HS1genome_0743 [Sulfodiicoccus acidiphilus]GGT90077.1 hypothetical protein GCM10007116_04790 [Sulfodiicoccus acidiphilus]